MTPFPFISGYTALHWSVNNNRLQVTQLLVQSKADVNARDNTYGCPSLVFYGA
jgi:ankyrin repeat protein